MIVGAFKIPQEQEPASLSKTHVYLDEENDPIKVELEDYTDLNPSELLSLANRKSVDMIRIATDVGDFCYTFKLPTGGAQVGLMTHVLASDPVGWLIYSTNLRKIGFVEVQRVVKATFNHQQQLKEKAP